MALRPQFSLINSEFNDFLFASVGEEKNGSTLTVLSALTRLGIDPWMEAARLSGLPGDTAARTLTAAIAGLPAGNWNASDLSAIATRLLSRLPKRSAPVARPSRDGRSRSEKVRAAAPVVVVCILFLAVAFLAISNLRTDHPSEPSPSPVSSIQR